MQWFYADGPLLNGGARWTGTLFRFDFGQPLNGNYGPPTNVGSSGTVTIDFSTRTRGVLTLPGGRQANIERYNFGVGSAPQSLLGDWLYVWSVGTATFADRFAYTLVTPATSGGNGVVTNAAGTAGAEYQVTGALAGQVVAVKVTSTGALLDQWLFTQYLEEGRGSWLNTTTQTAYGMNAYRTANTAGIVKSAAGTIPADARPGLSMAELDRLDPERAGVVREIVERLMEVQARSRSSAE